MSLEPKRMQICLDFLAVSSSNNNVVNNASVISIVTSSSVAQENSSTDVAISPSVKKNFFKKNVEDGMNRYESH